MTFQSFFFCGQVVHGFPNRWVLAILQFHFDFFFVVCLDDELEAHGNPKML